MTTPLATSAAPGAANLHRLSTTAAAATVLSQILWVLVPQDSRDAATIASVLLFATASVSHAAATRGTRWAMRYALLAVAVGWSAEAIGTTTGWPFGQYHYTQSLGPTIGPVPVVIPLAWLMMAYPVLLAARRITPSRTAQTGYAAALLTAWDLFLDPQMVAEGHWVWDDATPALPGVPGIPAQNFVGWFLVGLFLFGLAARLLRQTSEPQDDRVPAGMLLWVFASSVMANALFWDRWSVALVGGSAMGLLLAPWLRSGIASRDFWTHP